MNFQLITKDHPLFLPDIKVIGIVDHWTAGKYHQFLPHYHFCIDEDGSVHQNMDLFEKNRIIWVDSDGIGHTWKRNTGRIGIAVCAMYKASENKYGKYPYTEKQLESMCALNAKLADKYNVDIGEIKTHSEWAEVDGYGPGSGDPETRWDFWKEEEIIKNKTMWYIKILKKTKSKQNNK